jgi:uncharacterized protein YndB with AHSA1/START domain
MKNEFIARISRTLPVPSEKVWDALTNPVLIKQYFFGTDAVSEWKVGKPIFFRGTWEGKPYEDKGTILALLPGNYIKYNYWSSFSGTEDIPENYANVTYEVTPSPEGCILVITQDNIVSAESRDHSEKNWGMILDGMEKLLK